jgi:adenylate cyclase
VKKKPPVILAGIALTLLSFGFYLTGSDFIQAVSNYSYDAFMRRAAKPPQSGRVAIVDIDEDSLKYVGQWPWSRHVVAKLTTKILESGASVVAFDVVFPEKDRTSPTTISEDIRKHFSMEAKVVGLPESIADYDRTFADVLKRGKCILGIQMHEGGNYTNDVDTSFDPDFKNYLTLVGQGEIGDCLMQADSVTMSIPLLSEAAEKGFFNAAPDSDGVVRSNPLVWALGHHRLYPSLALEAVRLERGAPRCFVHYDNNGVTHIRIPPGAGGADQLVLPADQAGCLAVNYRKVKKDSTTGFASSFPVVSAGDILAGKASTNELRDKIVFVGTSAVGLKDIKATPVTQYFSGVEVHATIVDNILAGDMLWNPTWMVMIHSVSILVIGALLTFLISRARAWLSFLVTAATVFALIEGGLFLLRNHQVVFIPAWVILSAILVYLVLTMIMFWQEELGRKHVRDMFSTMVSREVLQYLEKNPDSFSLTGTKVEATMFFSDIAGFTTISEAIPAEKLPVLLNRYLSPMTESIMKRNGYVDKYEGDLIMAVWGVPFPSQDHAVQACLSALEQQKELARLRPVLKEEFGHDIHVRMGVNTGPVTAGNMGSDRKMQYTVLGESVNLASRLEPANKQYGTSIVISETTFLLARDHVEGRLLDILIAKGTSKPVRIYELLETKGGLSPTRAEVVSLYEEALRLHWERQWDAALLSLDRCLQIEPGDTASRRLRSRILRYKDNPPPEAWSGVLWVPTQSEQN